MYDKGKVTAAVLFTAVFISLLAGAGVVFAQGPPPSPPHRVWGVVTFENGSPAAGVTVNFVNDNGDVVVSDLANDNGYYDTDLPPGLETNISEPDDNTLEIYVGSWESENVLHWKSGGSEEINISNVPMPPSVTTESADNVGTGSAVLNMSYDFKGYDNGSVRFEYRKLDGSWNSTSWVSRSGSGSYSENITGLSSGTDYDFKAQLKYDGEVIEGSVLTFTTATPVNEPPTASFSYSPSKPNPGETVSFDASASSDNDGSIVSYEWTFGDGSTGSGKTVDHSYSSTDDYTVTLTVTDDNGAINSTSKIVSVVSPPVNEPPNADADGPYSVDEGGTVLLDGVGSNDPDFNIENYSWEIIDGPGSLENADSVHPNFVAPENVDSDTDVTVELTVTDDEGASDSATATITVNNVPAPVNEPPNADADGPYSVDENETVQLDGTGSGDTDGSVESYSWEIASGPGSLQNADSAEPTYAAPDDVDSDTDVTVELTVTDDDGATGTDTATVTVRNVPVKPPKFPVLPVGGIIVIIIIVIALIGFWQTGRL